jgi:hypothetical protein
MIRNIIYAILLGIGMAACLSQREEETKTETESTVIPEIETTEDETTVTLDPAAFVIQKGQAGSIQIGMPMDKLLNNVPKGYTITDTTLTQEGMQSTAYLLKPQNHNKGLLVEQSCNPDCTIWRINVKAPEYRTPNGIGIGSKYGELKQFHPISTVILADGGFVAVSKAAGLSFVLDTSTLPKSKLSSYTPETVPANTIVKSILIY